MEEFLQRTPKDTYSVPREAEKLFREELLRHPLVLDKLPAEVLGAGCRVHFSGSDAPVLPVNWRVAESLSALHGLAAALIGVLLKKKYDVQAPEVMINTDHAVLFPISLFLWILDPQGINLKATLNSAILKKYFVDTDLHQRVSTPYRAATTNIYKCSDDRYFQLHGSLNPNPVLDSISLPHQQQENSLQSPLIPFKEKISQLTSSELLEKIVDSQQAGDICNSVSEYLESDQGKATAHVRLFELNHYSSTTQYPGWWPAVPYTSHQRPLAGLKVVDLTRIIAAPAVTRSLAELGASVMRVTSPKIADFSGLHPDLNWGKWNTYLDFHEERDRDTLKALIKDADIVVCGYRPAVLDKYGFGQQDILNLVSSRDRGIVFVRINSYGWHGPYWDRPGWQPVSDAVVGISHGYGKALGLKNGEPVTPLFPVSDYSTGLIGISAILSALIQRGEKGGSFTIDLALNYFNQWLAQSCGEYPTEVWQTLWADYGKFVFRAENPMEYTAPRIVKMMEEKGCFKKEFFETRHSGVLGLDIRCVKPVIQFSNREVRLEYNVGTRGNGVDQPRWPDDLLTERIL